MKKEKLKKEFIPSILMKIVLILCIIAFGIGFIINGFVGFFNEATKDLILSDAFPTYLYFLKNNLLDNLTNFHSYYIISFFLYALILYGLVLMLKGSRLGFIFFFSSEVILILTPLMIFGRRAVALGDIMISLFLIVFFLIQINQRRIKSQEEIEEKEGINEINEEDI